MTWQVYSRKLKSFFCSILVALVSDAEGFILDFLCLQMRHHGNPSLSSSNGSMAEGHGGRTDGTEDKTISWMVEQQIGAETTAGSSTEDMCRQELNNYIEYVWRRLAHESMVSTQQWWRRRQYLWPWVANIARLRLATQTSSARSERSFRRQV